jgi:hypothetical protein
MNSSQMQGSVNGNSANIRAKILNLEDMTRQLAEELNHHKKEVQVLRSEKDTLESVLNEKTSDARKTLGRENFKVEQEIKRHYNAQKEDNARLQ